MTVFETVLARGPRFIIEQAQQLGVDEEDLLRAARLGPEEISDPDARIPVAKLADLWRAVLRRLPERGLGVRFGMSFDIRRSGLVGYIVMSSPDLRTAIEQIVRFSRILNEGVRPTLVTEGDRGNLTWLPSPFLRPYPEVADWGLAVLLTILRQATGVAFEPTEVWFPYPKPGSVPAEHRSHFGRGLRFDRGRLGLVLSRGQLELPVAAADTELGIYLERHAEQVLQGLSSSGELVDKVRGRIWQVLSDHRPSVSRTAASLGMSSRSLQRRLRQQGTSFGALRDEMLRTLATSLLHDRGLAIDEISFLLGYSEPSTFYRAFRRWERVSPVRYRAAG